LSALTPAQELRAACDLWLRRTGGTQAGFAAEIGASPQHLSAWLARARADDGDPGDVAPENTRSPSAPAVRLAQLVAAGVD